MSEPVATTAPKLKRGARRDPRVFDAAGHEVFITLICPHCDETKPLRAFGLRRMGDGTIRNAPWCRVCRSGRGVPIRITVRPDLPATGGIP